MHYSVRTCLLALCAILTATSTLRAQILLSEFQAANLLTLRDEDGDFEDWIELYNSSDAPVDVEGWSLTDDGARLTKWQFPSTNLAAGQYLVVFASSKDRRVPGNPLHTNFKLSADGEYLALVKPDGKTIATAFAPAYPPQANNVSYGLPMAAQSETWLGPGAAGKFLVPRDDSLGTSWVLPDFGDGTWLDIQTGVGFDQDGSSITNLMGTQVDAIMRGINASAYLRLPFVVTGLEEVNQLTLRMRYNDGFIAYLNGVPVASRNAPVSAVGGTQADSAADWSAAGQQGFNNWYYGFYDKSADTDGVYDPATDFNSTSSQWTWNGGAWVLGPSNPPWDLISVGGWQPNGTNSGGVHWPIRRWVSETSGQLTCRIAFAKEDVSCGSGTTLRVLHNGVERLGWTVAYNDPTGLHTNLVLNNVQQGDYIDFALDPQGTDGSLNDSCDGSTFSVVIDQTPSEGAVWNSSATALRSPDESSVPEEIDLTQYKDLLVAGVNVLAIQALNAGPNDPDFLVLPELVGSALRLNQGQAAYFTEPTPGGANGSGSLTLGPILSVIQHTPTVPGEDEDLVVQARVTPTLQPIGTVTLKYRVMYAAETNIAMFDDGQHDDGLAGDLVYGARIPATASRAGQMVRYSVVATDAKGQLTRAPAYANPKLDPQYFGTVVFDPALTNSRLRVLHWFIANPTGADSDTTARCSIFFDGEFYDNVGMNLHGQSTRAFPKKSYDIDFNPGYGLRWTNNAPRVGALNLITTWADKSHMRNILAHETYRDGGAPSHFAFPVRVQRNGAFFSVANVVENGGADFLKRLGLDPNGALYKMYNAADSVDLAEKKTRRYEGSQDLQALITGMGQATAARQTFMFDNLDLPEMIDCLAARIITADVDCCHKNYYLYRDSDHTREWQAMPWDVDLSFGRVWTCGSPCLAYYDETVYVTQSIFTGDGNRVFSPIYQTPATRQMFLRRLRTLMDELFQPPGTPATNDLYRLKTLALRDVIAPDAALDLAKWGTWGTRETITQAVNRIWNEFLPPRRTFLFNTMSVVKNGEIPLSQPTNAFVTFGGLEYRPASGNPLEEWLSLTNPNSYAVDISNWRLEGGVRFKFKPGTVVPSRAVIFVSPDVYAFRNRAVSPKGGEQRLVLGPYSGNLSAWGENLTLVDATGRLVNSNSFVGNPSPAQQYLRVTEIFYNPDPLPAYPSLDAQQFEFLELRNTGPVTLDLSGVRFTEGITFEFSSGVITTLAPGARLLLVRDINAFVLRYGAELPVAGQYIGSLDNGGERLRLEDSYGEKILDFSYSNQWHPITDGHGYSLAIVDDQLPWSVWGEKASWRPNGTLGGTPGQSDPLLPPLPPVVVNEILAHTDPPASDAVELFNAAGTNVDVGNWYLTDDFKVPRKFRIPSPTIIPAHGFTYFTEAQFNPAPGVPPSFALNSEGDGVWLFSADTAGDLTGYVQGFEFGATANGVSLGRYTNSVGEIDYPAQSAVTLGQTNASPLVGPVVLSEIMYHPAVDASNTPASYVELANVTSTNVPLFYPTEITNTWRLRNAVHFDFPTNVVLPPDGRLLVVGFDPATNLTALADFRALYGVDPQVPIYGPWQGRLDNGEETIELMKPDPWGTNGVPHVLVEKVHYFDSSPWPATADGAGASLQRRTLTAYGNEPTNWSAMGPSAGTPNLPDVPPTITWSSPSDGMTCQGPTNLALAATASDTDGHVLRVEFRADGQKLGDVLAPPYSFVWINPPGGRHTLTAYAVDNRLGSAESAPVSITVIPPPPAVSLTGPADGTVALAGSGLAISASAASSEGLIDRVDFFANDLLLAELLAPPYSTTWSPTQPGTYALTAVAIDNWGSRSTSAVTRVAFTMGTNVPVILVPAGSTWKYIDSGFNMGTPWRAPAFEDTFWKSGPAELGYGDDVEGRPEATQIGYGPNPAAKYITYYFRLAFTATQVTGLKDLVINLLRDDGAIVYLNGAEVFRSNMPEGDVNYLTLAANAVAGVEETTYYQKTVPASFLREGANVLAVEVHQSSASSSDLSFDLFLTGTRLFLAPAILAQPQSLRIQSGGMAVFSVNAGGTVPLGYQWLFNGTALENAATSSLKITNAEPSMAGTYQVLISNSTGSVQSAPATLAVVAPPSNLLAISPMAGGYRLQFYGPPGRVCQLQRSPDLLHWSVLLESAVPADGMMEYSDNSPLASGAYYRALQK